MNERDIARILEEAKAVLDKNWVILGDNAGFTKPAYNLYPFQWNWDSAFIAYGYAHYDILRALAELRALFKGQWASGMLPHIVFHETDMRDAKGYFPGPEIWGAQGASPNAPRSIQTSGITQPPLQAMALWHIYKEMQLQDEEAARSMLEEFFPKLRRLHRYLCRARDPEGSGFITIFHPWESGFDNSPRWDRALARIEPVDMSQYQRRDVGHVDPKFRPSDEEYGRYMTLLLELKKYGYDSAEVYRAAPFKVKDVLFSSIFYVANKRLRSMAEILGEKTEVIERCMHAFEEHLTERLWNEKDKMFYDYDVLSGEQIRVKNVASLMPLITGLLSEKQKKAMNNMLDQTNFCGQQACAVNLTPSLDIAHEAFDHELYWRGPIWINVNWFLWKGFVECGMHEKAKEMKEAMLKLVAERGFWEYYSPITGEGIGANDFAWSAALTIDLLHED